MITGREKVPNTHLFAPSSGWSTSLGWLADSGWKLTHNSVDSLLTNEFFAQFALKELSTGIARDRLITEPEPRRNLMLGQALP